MNQDRIKDIIYTQNAVEYGLSKYTIIEKIKKYYDSSYWQPADEWESGFQYFTCIKKRRSFPDEYHIVAYRNSANLIGNIIDILELIKSDIDINRTHFTGGTIKFNDELL